MGQESGLNGPRLAVCIRCVLVPVEVEMAGQAVVVVVVVVEENLQRAENCRVLRT